MPYYKRLTDHIASLDADDYEVAASIHESIADLFCRPLDHLTDEYKRGLLYGKCSALTVLLNQHGGDFNVVSLCYAYINHYAKED